MTERRSSVWMLLDHLEAVPVEVARQLQARLRNEDLLARLGGDELAVIPRNFRRFDVASVADTFRQVPQSSGGDASSWSRAAAASSGPPRRRVPESLSRDRHRV